VVRRHSVPAHPIAAAGVSRSRHRNRRPVALLVALLLVVGIVTLPPTADAAAQTAQVAAEHPCPSGGSDAGWALSTTTFDTAFYRHAVVGNGYLSQRVPPTGMGYVATGEPTGWPLYTPRYDGAHVAGLYASDPDLAEGREAIAAIPTWSTLRVGVGEESYTATTPAARISNYQQTLFLRCGIIRTALTWTSSDGRRSVDLVYDVLADRVNPHAGAVRVAVTPRFNGRVTVTDMIDGAGARRLVAAGSGDQGDGTVAVDFTAQTKGTAGTVASTLRPGAGVDGSAVKRTTTAADLTASQTLDFPARSGRTYEFVKYVGVDTKLTSADPAQAALSASRGAAQQGWSSLLSAHVASWDDLWRSDVEIPDRPDLQAWLRAGLYGLLSNIREGEDDSISPVGLTSDNYAGLIFWDAETWMFPALLALYPDVAESVLEYRYRTLPGARANAERLGYQGVFYPWNGASNGDLETECHSVDPPHCITQIHLQGDIALAAWQYFQATGDTDWLRDRGWPMLQGIAQFWAGRVTANADGTYSLNNVAGPDEYSNGVDDAVYTNAVASLALRNATRAAQILGESAPAQWMTIADNLRMPFDEERQVFLQYDGYDGSLIKQADTVLLIYPVEWPMSAEVASNTLDFYAERTDPDGPAMTDSVHAIDAAAIGEPGCATHTYLMRAIKPFVRDPFAQFAEARGDKPGSQDPLAGSPAFNFLTGEGGFAQVFAYGLTGMRWREDRVHLDPLLPPQLGRGVTLRDVDWRGRTFDITVGPDETTVRQTSGQPFEVESPQGVQVVSTGSPLTLKTRRPDLAPTDNVARCAPAQATSEEPGLYAEAAVDGSEATVWAPAEASGSLTVDLGRRTQVTDITVLWTDATPSSYRILTSRNGSDWSEVALNADGTLQHPVQARYVRVELTQATSGERTGIRELQVISR
jgi:trehalose/maltose hydrolase-like predicted phosphorylase